MQKLLIGSVPYLKRKNNCFAKGDKILSKKAQTRVCVCNAEIYQCCSPVFFLLICSSQNNSFRLSFSVDLAIVDTDSGESEGGQVQFGKRFLNVPTPWGLFKNSWAH